MGSGADKRNEPASLVPGANDRQVGGDHYKAKVQHWDIVVDHDLNYFEAQILRYVMRCRRKKNMLEDLNKARHFIDKYIELVTDGKIDDPTKAVPQRMMEEAMKRQYSEAKAYLASTI